MRTLGASILTDVGRDREAYRLARTYLLSFGSHGVTDEVLQRYLCPSPLTDTTMAAVFNRLLKSARNRSMMATVISESTVESLRRVLDNFDPATVSQHFASPDELLDIIEEELKLRFPRKPRSLWPLFARAILSGARFLNQFASGPKFLAWVQQFDDDPLKRNALPLLSSHEIDGFGLALACDFLKELGFLNFPKPDVHVNAIVKELKLLSSDKTDDYAVFKAMVRIAEHCGKPPYDVDKLFWLVGSGDFYNDPSIGLKGRTNRGKFIQGASRDLGVAA